MLSTGRPCIPGPKPQKALLERLWRLSRSLSRKGNGSANRRNAKATLDRAHARIGHIRRDAQHKLSTDLTHRFHTICIEDLNVKGMMANRQLAHPIADMGFHEFRRPLEYKDAMRGGGVVVADRWFASRKIGSHCEHKRDSLALSMHEWMCPECGMTHDRDGNAATDLENYAVSSTVAACGGESAGLGGNTRTEPAPVKQDGIPIATCA